MNGCSKAKHPTQWVCVFSILTLSLSGTRTLFRHLAINAKRFRTTTLGWNTHHRGECIAAHWLCECHSLTRCLCVFALEIFKFLLKGMYLRAMLPHTRTHIQPRGRMYCHKLWVTQTVRRKHRRNKQKITKERRMIIIIIESNDCLQPYKRARDEEKKKKKIIVATTIRY